MRKEENGEGRGNASRAWSREYLRNGRDEMNLVEFPFATLSDRADEVQVLEFQVQDSDRETGLPVDRKLKVTGHAKYGIPTAKDVEIYLRLLQLPKFHTDYSAPI